MKLIKNSITLLRFEGLKTFLKGFSGNLFLTFLDLIGLGHFLIPIILNKFGRYVETSRSIDQAVDFAYSFQYLGLTIRPVQVKEEIVKLLRLLEKIKPKVVFEIGTFFGGTLYLFCKTCGPETVIISVDFPGNRYVYPKWKIDLYKRFKKNNQEVHLIRADSHDLKTFEKIKNLLGDRKIDFCFIDGDHSYEGVKSDFEMYSSLIRKKGIIALHDIVSPPHLNYGVNRFWKELKRHGYKFEEIIEEKGNRKAGIGIIYL
jgi:predicted O-methyltransferase YrrM